MNRWHWAVAAVFVGCASTANAQTPLNATFRCANNAGCPAGGPPDAIQGDSVDESGFTFAGFRTWSVAGKGKNQTVYLDGAFVNSAGGISVNLVPESTQAPDRALALHFGNRVEAFPSGNTPAACLPDGTAVLSNQADFRFNLKDGETALGIDALDDGGTVGPSGSTQPGAGTRWVIGIVTVLLAPNVQADLFFNYSQGYFDGAVTLARSGGVWTLTSDATVLLRCRVLPTTGKGAAKIYDVGTYHMPFQLTVQR